MAQRRIDANNLTRAAVDVEEVMMVDSGGTPVSPPTAAGQTAANASLASIDAKLPASLGAKTGAASLSVVPASDGFAVTATGNVASGATDSGNGVKIAGLYSSSPATVTNGQRVDIQVNSKGSLAVSAENASNSDNQSAQMNTFQDKGGVARLMGTGIFGYNGAGLDRLRGDTVALSVTPGLSASFWGYAAAASGISNTTTAVTIKAAAGASVRNYITGIQIDSTALGAATEIAIRDGAGGTVLWRGYIGTAGYINGRNITFPNPLKGTANTLLEVVTLTASVTGTVYFNAQGFTGA